MDIQAINDIFKDITESITGLNGYAFGWPADRVRGRDPETDTEMEYPRVFFAVPTVQQDVLRNQDIYSITLYFDDLQGYNNAGETVNVTQLGQWSGLQLIAQKWLNEFKSRHYEREPDYAGINSPVSFTLDSFGGMQRMATVQMSFSLVTPSMCGITITVKVARLNASATATLAANAKIARIATAGFNVVSTLVATAVKGGAVIQIAESALLASATLTAQAQRAKQAEVSATATGTLSATAQRALIAQSGLNATGSLTATAKRAKLAQLNAIASATLQALAIAEQQGIQNAYAMLYGVAGLTSSAQVAKQAQMDANATATLSATAKRALVATFTAEASAVLSATLAAIRVVQAQFTAQAETNLTAIVSKAIQANLTAQADTTLQAIVSRSVSANMTATAQTNLLAVLANQVVMLASAGGTLSATAKKAVYRSASLSASGTLSATTNSIPFTDVSLLLHFNGTDNGTTFTDSSNNTFVPTTSGAPVTKTGVKKFGTASLYVGGADLLQYAHNSKFNFDQGDFTIEFWFNPITQASAVTFILRKDILTTGINYFRFRYEGTASASSGKLTFLINKSDATTIFLGSTSVLTLNTFTHVAVSRVGNSLRMFINGVVESTADLTGVTLATNTEPLQIGSRDARSTFYIDELRYTKGYGRYESNFTPQTQEF